MNLKNHKYMFVCMYVCMHIQTLITYARIYIDISFDSTQLTDCCKLPLCWSLAFAVFDLAFVHRLAYIYICTQLSKYVIVSEVSLLHCNCVVGCAAVRQCGWQYLFLLFAIFGGVCIIATFHFKLLSLQHATISTDNIAFVFILRQHTKLAMSV